MEWVAWVIIGAIPFSMGCGVILVLLMRRRWRNDTPAEREARIVRSRARANGLGPFQRISLQLALGFPIAAGMIVAAMYGVVYLAHSVG